MSDDTTIGIDLTIPRIELSPLKSTEIKLYLSVVDQNGDPLTLFNQYNFTIKQVCTGEIDTTVVGSITFGNINQQGGKIAAAATMDYSGSMDPIDIVNMEEAIKYFINLKNSDDYMEIVKFASLIQVATPFTQDVNTLIQAVETNYSLGSSTSLYDVLNSSISDADDFYNSNLGVLPAVIGFTDGKDTHSTSSMSSVISNAIYAQVPVYAIGFGGADDYVLGEIAEQTGGRYYYAPNSNELNDLYSLISGQLKNLYVVTWEYDNPSCDHVTIIVTSSYTCANGTFYSWAEKSFFPLK